MDYIFIYQSLKMAIFDGWCFIFDSYITAGIAVQQLQITTRVSNGDIVPARVNTSFNDSGTEITWGSCFRYGSTTWVGIRSTAGRR